MDAIFGGDLYPMITLLVLKTFLYSSVLARACRENILRQLGWGYS